MTRRRHPTTDQLANILERLAKNVREHGGDALELAPLLAARGWPTTSGAAGSTRSGNAELTSVEAAADRPSPYDDIDVKLRWWMATAHSIADVGLDLITKITAHAATDDQHDGRATGQAGTGTCLACDRWVTGTANDRLRAGFCDSCRKAWERAGRPDRAAFIRARPKSDEPHPSRRAAG